MAITSITITQDNVVNGSVVMPVHSPLVFIADVVWTVEAPTDIRVDITEGSPIVPIGPTIETFKAIPYKDIDGANTRQFAFVANDVVKGLMDDFDDEIILSDVATFQENMMSSFSVKFYDPLVPTTNDFQYVNFLHAASQFGELPNKPDVNFNTSDVYYGAIGTYVYVYFFNTNPFAASIGFAVDGGGVTTTASGGIGVWRVKLLATDADKSVQFYVDAGAVGPAQILRGVEACTGQKTLKFLDTDGRYRFHSFNQYYEMNDNPKKIGTTNKFITNIYTDKTNKQNVGYRNDRTLSLSSNVPNDELEKLTDLYTSPRVYLHIGDDEDDLNNNWLEVDVKASPAIVRRRKANSGKIDVLVTLPEHFTIKMI